jgi:hypothetical protein
VQQKPYMTRRGNKVAEVLEQTRAFNRQALLGSPLNNSSVGEGGLDIIEGGRFSVIGEDSSLIFEVRAGTTGFMYLQINDLAGIRAEPGFYYTRDYLALAGPAHTGSRAATGFGGSDLRLNARDAILAAGLGSSNVAQYWVGDEGWVRASNANARMELSPTGDIALGGPGAGYIGSATGAWSAGDASRAVIQGTQAGGLGVWAKPGWFIDLNSHVRINSNLDVVGTKNFLMAHPAKPGHTIRYAATESPVSAIECRGRATIGEDGTATVEYPEHFTAIVKPDTDVDVSVNTYGPDAAWCDVPTGQGTTIHGTPGTVVAWKAYAERLGGDFVVVEEGTIEQPVPAAPSPTTSPVPAAPVSATEPAPADEPTEPTEPTAPEPGPEGMSD